MTAAFILPVNIGSPATDDFTKGVFNQTLEKACTLTIDSQGLASVRNEIINEVPSSQSRDRSLDIIADAPHGKQKLANIPLSDLFDPRSNNLIDFVRSSFRLCRLLGCSTSLDRRWMLQLADLLRMPVVGTTCAIGSGDFCHTSFHDVAIIDCTAVSLAISTEEMTPSGKLRDPALEALIASGAIQERWLSQYEQVHVAISDVAGEIKGKPRIVPIRDDFFDKPVARTGVIETAPFAEVALQTHGGTLIPAEVLVSGTLLRLTSKRYGPVYVNVPPNGDLAPQLPPST